MGHIHPVWNDDPLFVIDPDSRTISKESSNGKTQLMQYDHNSEVFRFEIPKVIEGHSITDCDIKQIHYINSGTGTSVSNRESNVGIYEIPEIETFDDPSDYVYFDWLVSQNATQLVGDLKFQIKFGCTNPDRPGEIDYMWGSQVYSAVEILPGINNAEIVVTEYTDILTQWKAEIDRSLDEMNEKLDNIGDISGGDLSGYVKNTDYATLDKAGVVKAATSGNTYGVIMNSNNILQIAGATKNDITLKANQNKPITPANLEYAVEVCTNQDIESELTEAQLKLPPSTQYLRDVFNTRYATAATSGTVKVQNYQYGLNMTDGFIRVYPAERDDVVNKVNTVRPVSPGRFDFAMMHGTHQTMSDDYDPTTILTTDTNMTGQQGKLPVSYNAVKGYVDDKIGDISTALDNIITLQTSYIGGDDV